MDDETYFKADFRQFVANPNLIFLSMFAGRCQNMPKKFLIWRTNSGYIRRSAPEISVDFARTAPMTEYY